MKTSTTNRKRSMSGFSLIEMLITVAVLIIIMGAVFSQINKSQKKYRAEESRVDLTQQTREFMDQMVRDLRQAGYPNQKMYDGSALMNPLTSDEKVAVGLVRFRPDDVWFEGDMNGDGSVEYVRYRLVPGPGTTCPCRIERLQRQKANATAPNAQAETAADYSVALDGVINSGGGAAGALSLAGTMQFKNGPVSINTYYATYKNAPVFQAFDGNGTEVTAADFTEPDYKDRKGIYSIKTIVINLNVMPDAGAADLQTGLRPVQAVTASVRILN